MNRPLQILSTCLLGTWLLTATAATAQLRSRALRWSADGNAVVNASNGGISRTDVRSGLETSIVTMAQLTPPNAKAPIPIADFAFSRDSSQVLIFTNTARVWRYNTRGDYYLLSRRTGQLR